MYQRMFQGCTGLTYVTIENALDDPVDNDHRSLAGCFSGCSNINSIVVYAKVLNVDIIEDCFDG